MKLLIFAASEGEAHTLADHFSTPVGIGVTTITPRDDQPTKERKMREFQTGDTRTLIVCGSFAAIGWRAPPETHVMFSSSFLEAADRATVAQAAARADRAGDKAS